MGSRRDHRLLVVLWLCLFGTIAPAQQPPSSRRTADSRPSVTALAEAVAAADRDHGPTSSKAASARRALADGLHRARRVKEAIAMLRESLAILRAQPSPDPAHLALTQGSLAAVLYSQNDVDEALALARDAVANALVAFGDSHATTCRMMFIQAAIELRCGLSEAALVTTRRLLAIQRDASTADAATIHQTLAGLCDVYIALNRYSEARAALEEAEALARTSPAVPTLSRANVAASLSFIETRLGRMAEARRHAERQLALLDSAGNVPRRERLVALANVAAMCLTCDDRDAARDSLRRGAELAATMPADELDSQLLLTLATLARRIENRTEAREFASKVEARESARDEPDVAALARALEVLGLCFMDEGRPDEAVPRLERAVAECRRSLGMAHRVTAAILNTLGTAHLANGATANGERVLRASLGAARDALAEMTCSLSESERLALIGRSRRVLDQWLSVALASDVDPRLVADEVVAWKGQVLRGLLVERSWIRAHAGADVPALQARLARVIDDLAPESLLATASGRPSVSPGVLVAERERLERELLARSPSGIPGKTSAVAVSDGLRDDEAILDFLAYGRGVVARGDTQITPCLLAVVLRHGRPPRVADLGPVAPVRAAVDAHIQIASRSTVPDPSAEPLSVATAAAARRALLEPVASDLAGVRHLFIVPDSFLCGLPFETLPGSEPTRYLLEELDVTYLAFAGAHERSPGGGPASRPRSRRTLLLGDVAFGDPDPAESRPSEFRTLAGFPLDPLPATAAEIEAIAAILERGGVSSQDVVRLTAANATEAAVKRLASGARILHLATHGLFAPDLDPSRHADGSMGSATTTAVESQRPFVRSALACAGANRRGPPGTDDGLLTAAEATWLDLGTCELVTLSCCESGLGTARSGENLLGMRRALALAGARCVVSSLWRVTDRSASDVMTRFYERLILGGEPKSTALRGARLDVLRECRARSRGQGLPGVWGAFILDGDWQ